MRLNSILLFSALSLLTSCNGQSKSTAANDRSTVPEAFGITLGDTVIETHDSIPVVFQAKNNMYWFGSNGHGVYSYDAVKKTLINYTTKDGLCNNHLWRIIEDDKGNIYFNTKNGISKYDGKTFTTLKPVKSTGPDKGWRLDPGDLWFTAAQDSAVVYRYDGKILHSLEFPKTVEGEELIRQHPRSQFPHKHASPYDVYSIFKDRKGNIWFGTGSLGVCRYDGKSFTWISEDELEYSDIAYGVRSTIEDKDGKFWFSNTMHRYDIDGEDGKELNYRKEKGLTDSNVYEVDNFAYFMSSVLDNTGALWMVTFSAGVWRYDGKNVIHFPVKKGDEIVTLFTIFKDNQGDLWLGTHVDGAYKFNGKTFERFKF